MRLTYIAIGMNMQMPLQRAMDRAFVGHCDKAGAVFFR